MRIERRTAAADALALGEVLDLKAAAPLAAALLARRGTDLEVDASEVRRLGGLCLQVLLSAASTWEADGATLTILNPAGAFEEGLDRLGAARLHAA